MRWKSPSSTISTGASYYLLFCTHDYGLAPWFKARFPGHHFRSTDYAMVGDSPTGSYTIHGTEEIMPEPLADRFYANQFVNWRGDW